MYICVCREKEADRFQPLPDLFETAFRMRTSRIVLGDCPFLGHFCCVPGEMRLSLWQSVYAVLFELRDQYMFLLLS